MKESWFNRNFLTIFFIFLLIGILMAIYYAFFDKTLVSPGSGLEPPPDWCSGPYCE